MDTDKSKMLEGINIDLGSPTDKVSPSKEQLLRLSPETINTLHSEFLSCPAQESNGPEEQLSPQSHEVTDNVSFDEARSTLQESLMVEPKDVEEPAAAPFAVETKDAPRLSNEVTEAPVAADAAAAAAAKPAKPATATKTSESAASQIGAAEAPPTSPAKTGVAAKTSIPAADKAPSTKPTPATAPKPATSSLSRTTATAAKVTTYTAAESTPSAHALTKPPTTSAADISTLPAKASTTSRVTTGGSSPTASPKTRPTSLNTIETSRTSLLGTSSETITTSATSTSPKPSSPTDVTTLKRPTKRRCLAENASASPTKKPATTATAATKTAEKTSVSSKVDSKVSSTAKTSTISNATASAKTEVVQDDICPSSDESKSSTATTATASGSHSCSTDSNRELLAATFTSDLSRVCFLVDSAEIKQLAKCIKRRGFLRCKNAFYYLIQLYAPLHNTYNPIVIEEECFKKICPNLADEFEGMLNQFSSCALIKDYSSYVNKVGGLDFECVINRADNPNDGVYFYLLKFRSRPLTDSVWLVQDAVKKMWPEAVEQFENSSRNELTLNNQMCILSAYAKGNSDITNSLLQPEVSVLPRILETTKRFAEANLELRTTPKSVSSSTASAKTEVVQNGICPSSDESKISTTTTTTTTNIEEDIPMEDVSPIEPVTDNSLIATAEQTSPDD